LFSSTANEHKSTGYTACVTGILKVSEEPCIWHIKCYNNWQGVMTNKEYNEHS